MDTRRCLQGQVCVQRIGAGWGILRLPARPAGSVTVCRRALLSTAGDLCAWHPQALSLSGRQRQVVRDWSLLAFLSWQGRRAIHVLNWLRLIKDADTNTSTAS